MISLTPPGRSGHSRGSRSRPAPGHDDLPWHSGAVGCTKTQPTIHLPENALDAVTKGIDYSDERAWIPWAWAALVRAGDAPAELDEFADDYASHIITLAALGFLYERFQDVYAGTESDDELMMELMGTDRPDITDVDVARYCERHGYASGECPETGEGLLQVAVESRRVDMKIRLREILGDGRLFTSLVVACRPLPLPEYDEDGNETEPLGDSLAGLMQGEVTIGVSRCECR